MTTPGPYQYCSTCGKETAHNWIAETTYACIGCGKETKVYLRKALEKIGAVVKSPVQEGLSHLDSEALANVQQHMNTIQEKLEEVKEIIEDKGFQTELPKQGFEIKHTPLEVPEGMYHEEHGQFPAKEILEKFGDQLTNSQKIILQTYEVMDEETERKVKAIIADVTEQPVQKGWADQL